MASATQDLDLFVRDALARGASKESVAEALSAAGWSGEPVQTALRAYADVPFVIPVPRPRAYLSAREAFLYLTMFATLYLAAWHLGSLLFDLINHAWPDATISEFQVLFSENSMRWSTASVAITFPVFLFVARLIGKELRQNPAKRLSAVRRWLTYLTLFVAAIALICDMTTLLYNVLGGELTIRFVLKVLVAAVIAGTIFTYYLWDLRREEQDA